MMNAGIIMLILLVLIVLIACVFIYKCCCSIGGKK